MNSKRTFLFCCLFLMICGLPCFAQEDVQVVSHVEPPYSSAAAQVKVSGVVNIQIIIDKNGAVKSADVASGHPLLRNLGLQAAKGWKFNASTQEERKFVIVYSFVLIDLSAVPENKPREQGVLTKTEHNFISPNQVEVRGILEYIPKTCCRPPTSAWHKIAYPFRKVGSFFKRMFS